MNKSKSFLDDDDKDIYFIHFQTSKECEQFKKIFIGKVGHTCCKGNGVKIISWNGVNVDSHETLNKIRKKYNSK